MDAAVQPEVTPRLPPGLPDGWTFDRDLTCPKCRYNLRMLRVPRCPECGTVFRWQALLAITCPRCAESLETTDADECPRCDLALDWQRLLESANPAQLKQYEYTSRPLAAAINTTFSVLRPRRFWAGIQIESQPAVRRLRLLRSSAVCCVALGLILVALVNRPYTGSYIGGYMGGYVGWDPIYTIAAIALLPPFVTALAMPLFTPTLTRFRIRRDQLLRCSAYGCCGLHWVGGLLLMASAVAIIVNLLKITPRQAWPRGSVL